jgi:predicted phosphoribosyltransferase
VNSRISQADSTQTAARRGSELRECRSRIRVVPDERSRRPRDDDGVAFPLDEAPLFADRRHAGRVLARALEREGSADTVVVGLARGGVAVAAEVAAWLGVPLDAVAVRKVGHPWWPEYALGAVAPAGGVYVRAADGLTAEQLRAAVADAEARAEELDRRLHADVPPVELRGRRCLLVDDGLATGATMIAAVRWARARAAERVVAAAPVAARESCTLLAAEADAVVCPYRLAPFRAVGAWYGSFGEVRDAEVVRLLAAARPRRPAQASVPASAGRAGGSRSLVESGADELSRL